MLGATRNVTDALAHRVGTAIHSVDPKQAPDLSVRFQHVVQSVADEDPTWSAFRVWEP